jgi:hypothetical protein
MNERVTDVYSYSKVIRDVFFDVLRTAPFFAEFYSRKSKALQIQPQHLPYFGVYIVDEQMVPDGDPNHGFIGFIHTLRLGFSVIVVNNDPPACEDKLDQAFWTIMNRLWRDQYITNMWDTRSYPGGIGTPDNTRIEGVARGTRRHVWGNATFSQEIPLGELQYEASVIYRTMFDPIIDDDFLRMHMTTGIKIGETEEEMARRPQVQAVYDFVRPDTGALYASAATMAGANG